LLQRLLETTTQHYATIWSIYVSHGSALTQIRRDAKMSAFYIISSS